MHQAIGVLDALGIYRSLQLLGHSMGAVIAARIAGILADRLVLLTLMAPLLDHSRPVPVRTTQRTIR